MARTFTLAQLRQRVRDEADMHGGYIADAELNRYISAGYTELYDLLVSSGLAYFESSQTYTAAGSDTFALPADFMGDMGVDYQESATRWVPLRPLQPRERNLYTSATSQRAEAYRIVGANLVVSPLPPSGQVYRLTYAPRPADLAADGDLVDGVSGWEEFIVIEAAIKCLAKEDADVSGWLARKAAMQQRIEAQRDVRSKGASRAIVDIYEEPVTEADFLRRWEGGWS